MQSNPLFPSPLFSFLSSPLSLFLLEKRVLLPILSTSTYFYNYLITLSNFESFSIQSNPYISPHFKYITTFSYNLLSVTLFYNLLTENLSPQPHLMHSTCYSLSSFLNFSLFFMITMPHSLYCTFFSIFELLL
jgi:hypothetical protein